MLRDSKKMFPEDAPGMAQFMSEGRGVAEKLGPKWSQACRKIEINRLKSIGYMAESEGFEP